MFTNAEKENFAVHGLLKRKNFLAADKLESARKAIFRHFERQGIWRDGQWHPDAYKRRTEHDSGIGLVKPLNSRKVFADLIADEVAAAASVLVGGRTVLPMGHCPTLLFTLPNAASWTLPHKNWHLDIPRSPDGKISGVQIFALLETVAAGGGGTLAVTGSHRLLNREVRMKSSDLRKRLTAEPYFAELMSDSGADRMHFLRDAGHMRDVEAGDVELQVVEMSGEAGDVYFMDLRMLHNGAPNARQIPRIMLTERYLLESARFAIFGK